MADTLRVLRIVVFILYDVKSRRFFPRLSLRLPVELDDRMFAVDSLDNNNNELRLLFLYNTPLTVAHLYYTI
jgi:hypothetical protein